MFDNKGIFVIERTVALDEDTMMEYCLEAEADDYIVEVLTFNIKYYSSSSGNSTL